MKDDKTLIREYYEAWLETTKCTDLILSSGRTEEAARIMNKYYDAQSALFASIGVKYHGNKPL